MIVRFDINNWEEYDDYQQWTEGYLEVPSMSWLNAQRGPYKEVMRNLLKKYDLYSDKIESIIDENSEEDLVFCIQHFVEDEENYPSDLREKTLWVVKGIYFIHELRNLTFFLFIKSLPGVKEIEVVQIDSHDDDMWDMWGIPGLYMDLTDNFESLGLDPQKINSVPDASFEDMVKYIEGDIIR